MVATSTFLEPNLPSFGPFNYYTCTQDHHDHSLGVIAKLAMCIHYDSITKP